MYKHNDVAGDWARNSKDQIVAAWDPKRAIKGATYKYFCHCPCRQPLTFRDGQVKRPHFAYKANRKTGCVGGNSFPETKLHYDTKWFLHDNFSKINFWRLCHMGHRISKNQYPALQWTAKVEKKIPGTGRIADVLLMNRITDEAVALEVLNSHAVGEKKRMSVIWLVFQLSKSMPTTWILIVSIGIMSSTSMTVKIVLNVYVSRKKNRKWKRRVAHEEQSR